MSVGSFKGVLLGGLRRIAVSVVQRRGRPALAARGVNRWWMRRGLSRSSASALRVEMVRDMSGQKAEGFGQRRVLLDACPEPAKELRLHGRQIDSRHASIMDDRFTGDDQLVDMAGARAREQQVQRIESGV